MMSYVGISYTLLFFIFGVTVIGCNNENKKQLEREQKIAYQKGKHLFREHCDGCHHEGMVYIMTGPALGPALEKRDSTWTIHHIKQGSYAATEDKDSISIALRAEGWGFMPGFDFLEDQQIEAILYFMKEEYKKNKHLEKKD